MKKFTQKTQIVLLILVILAGALTILWIQTNINDRLNQQAKIKTVNYGKPASINEETINLCKGYGACELVKKSGLQFVSEDDIRWYLSFQKSLSDKDLINKLGQDEYYKQYDRFKALDNSISKHIAKILIEDVFFKTISPEPDIYGGGIAGQAVIDGIYNEPDKDNNGWAGYRESKKTLFKYTSTSDLVGTVSAYTKNESSGHGSCFIREGYDFLVDMMAKKVIYAAQTSSSGCE